MNTKSLLAIAALCGLAWVEQAIGQTAGASGGGTASSSGPATTTSTPPAGSTSSTSSSSSTNPLNVGSAGGSDIGALATPGTPNTSPTMPSRSVLDRNTSTTRAGATSPDNPAVIGSAPARPGISPLSGLPTSSLPSVSAGTTPIGPDSSPILGAGSTPGAPTGISSGTEVRPRPRNTTTQPIAGAADPLANPAIGMGLTTVVPTPPPTANVETAVPAATDSNHAWVPGHYSWVNGQWTWNDGGWQRPPSPGATWVPGSYDAQNHRWTEGHWNTTSAVSRERDRLRDSRDER